MRKKLKFFTFLLLPILSCSTNSTQVEESFEDKIAVDVEVKETKTVLWKLEGDYIKTSYLFGTMHMINEEYFHFSENLTDRIINSEALIMEVGGMPNPIAAFKMMSLDSGRVHQYFNAEQLKELLQFMDIQMGISPQEFDQTYGAMKPFFILQSISQSYFETTAESYDLKIMGLSAENEIPLIGLETIEEQLSFFDSIPPAKMAELIVESIRDFEKEQKNIIKLMEYYSEQKVDKLIPLLEKQSPEFMEYEDLFIYNRNKKWVPKLINEMKSKSCFIAVGAGHLFGERGLIELLRSQDLKLTPISTL